MNQTQPFERNQNESTVSYLQRLKEMGFLFHGSANDDISDLEPRDTHDPDSAENTDTAVFATHNVSWAIIFGLYGGHTGWSTESVNGKVTAKITSKDKDLVESTIGAVYVVPRETFKSPNGNSQYKSHEPVQPLVKVPVTVTDYNESGGLIEWQ